MTASEDLRVLFGLIQREAEAGATALHVTPAMFREFALHTGATVQDDGSILVRSNSNVIRLHLEELL